MKKHEVKKVVRKAAGAAHVATGAKAAAGVAKEARTAPAAAGGQATNSLEAHYQSQKDAAKREKAAKVAAMRKEVAEKLAKPDPELDAAMKTAEENRKAKKAKAAKPKGERKPGLLALAADVLKDASAPMNCRTIVEKVLAQGVWQTKGKTPSATLYAAIIREIAAKGKDARFRKTGKNLFEAVAAAK